MLKRATWTESVGVIYFIFFQNEIAISLFSTPTFRGFVVKLLITISATIRPRSIIVGFCQKNHDVLKPYV
tara:strand:- start:236 stop:445 length:210 start_codon:yes stop_codon:yes gene_type:complete